MLILVFTYIKCTLYYVMFDLQVADLKKMIDDLKADVDKVKQLHSKILSTPVPDES